MASNHSTERGSDALRVEKNERSVFIWTRSFDIFQLEEGEKLNVFTSNKRSNTSENSSSMQMHSINLLINRTAHLATFFLDVIDHRFGRLHTL